MESRKIPIETYLSKLRQYINKWCFEDDDIELEECEETHEIINKIEEELRKSNTALYHMSQDYLHKALNGNNAFLFPFRDAEEMAKEYLEGYSGSLGKTHKIKGCDIWCNLECDKCKKRK